MISENIQTAIIVAIPPTLVAIASVIVSLKNRNKLDVLHDSVNGKMEKLLAVSKVADESVGKEKGIAQEKEAQQEREEKK